LRRTHRKRKSDHDRWLVSYADFVTLLFAFFVVLFTSSTIDQSKIHKFAAKFESLVGRKGPPRVGPDDAAGTAPNLGESRESLTLDEMGPTIERLKQELLPEIDHGKIEISLQPRGLVMSLRESGFFAAGGAELQPASLENINKVAKALSNIPGQIRLEGHTDDRPIHTEKYPSNWQLSTARAIAVVNLLVREHGVSPKRLAVAGYGESRPLVPNDSPENQAKNRRVDIVILTEDAAAMEPMKVEAVTSP
jgi:chemotaxis protein MotB